MSGKDEHTHVCNVSVGNYHSFIEEKCSGALQFRLRVKVFAFDCVTHMELTGFYLFFFILCFLLLRSSSGCFVEHGSSAMKWEGREQTGKC